MTRWLIYFFPALIVECVAWLLTPIVCLFVIQREHTDVVKRRGKAVVTMQREFLPDWLWGFQTHDNPACEWFWGLYGDRPAEAEYLSSWWWRYYCRVRWFLRNTGYGFMYRWFGLPVEPESVSENGERNKALWYRVRSRQSSWQLQYQIPLGKRFIDGNIGWKRHDNFDRLMYANRLIGLRQYEA